MESIENLLGERWRELRPILIKILDYGYARGVRDGQKGVDGRLHELLIEARDEGYAEGYREKCGDCDDELNKIREEGFKEGYEVGYGERSDEVDVFVYEEGYVDGFGDAINGRMSEIKGVVYTIDGKEVPSEEINVGGDFSDNRSGR